MKRLAFAFLPILELAACDPISEDECRGGAWSEKGFSDGKSGRSVSILERYAEICSEFDVTPARDVYLAGREQGLALYCTPENAYEIGRKGGSVNSVCSIERAQDMGPAYSHGRKYHEIRTEIREIDNKMDELRVALNGLPAPTTDTEADAIRRLKRQLRSLDDDRSWLISRLRRYDSWP